MGITEREKNAILRELYPLLSERELREAEENLRRYFEIALKICGEQESHSPGADVDSPRTSPTIEERSNVSLKN
jgi:hypothetical protein